LATFAAKFYMSYSPSLPKGTRDQLPQAMLNREYILRILKDSFKKFGFQAIETPAMEKLSTLTGKYGEEGDRLIFKILPRGEKLTKALADGDEAEKALNHNVEEALRYDLTVPFARFVVQNRNELVFPFKRYQIQPVWRADRPQKGRYREFYQCDADVVGSDSLLLELDFISLYSEVFESLKLPVEIRLNHRKVLAGIVENFGLSDHFGAFTVALDKLDKIGLKGVINEMKVKEMGASAEAAITSIAGLKGSNEEMLAMLPSLIGNSEMGAEGLSDLSFILNQAKEIGVDKQLFFDFTLARGLDYYTGAIFEVKASGIDIGSIGGGGRYDDLTGIFGLNDMPGIGISFGLDRIELALMEANLLPELKSETTEVLFINFGQDEALYSMKLARELRQLNVKSEVYPDEAKLKKQMAYANKKEVSFVVMIGSNEMSSGRFTLKDMKSGEQLEMGRIELLEKFNSSHSNSYGKH
jgi:histidyl-tRNA synthetase